MDYEKKLRADKLFEEGDYVGALIEYSDILTDDPTGEIAYRLGVCNEKGLEDKEGAKFFYNMAKERGYEEPGSKPAPKPAPKPKKLTLEERAERGDADAQFTLGCNYYFGNNGYEVNHAEAAKWYRKAADQGHANAQYNLGNRYLNGQGVKKDVSEAVIWYKKAAANGVEDAKEMLDKLGY